MEVGGVLGRRQDLGQHLRPDSEAEPPQCESHVGAAPPQVEAADGHPGEQVRQPRQHRVVARHRDLGEQLAGFRQPVERRQREGPRRQLRCQEVRRHRRQHQPDAREAEQRPRPQTQERQAEQEQHAVVGEDHRQPRLEVAQQQPQRRDQQGPHRQPGGGGQPLLAAHRPHAAGHQRQADSGQDGEQRRGPATRQPVPHRPVLARERRHQGVGRDHADQRQAAGDVQADQAARSSGGAVGQNPTRRAAVPAHRLALGPGLLPQLGLEGHHPGPQVRVARGQDAYGEQPRVAGVADGHGRDRHPGRHLHDREQRVHPVEVLQRHRYADHGQRRHRGQHARQVRGATGAGDDHLQPAVGGAPAVVEHLVGHPVRRHHVGLVGDAELRQRLGGVLHHRPVGVGPHHDADLGSAHSLVSPRSPANQAAAWRARSRQSSRSSP